MLTILLSCCTAQEIGQLCSRNCDFIMCPKLIYSLSMPRKDIVVGVYSYLFIDIVIDRQMGKKNYKIKSYLLG